MSDISDTTQPSDESIPDFIQLQQIPVNYIQQVETDLLEPVVFSQGSTTNTGFTRFTLQNKGFLHSHSKIFMSIVPESTNEDVYFAPQVGIGQVIKKAVLKVGNKILNELDSWNSLYAVKSSLITNESNIDRELATTGRWLNHKFVYNTDSEVFASNIGLNTDVEPEANNLFLPDWSTMDATEPTECPTYMIDLSDLFPFLKVHQLPLYMINEPINIELTFEPTTKFRAQIGSGDTTDIAMNIDRNELKFCADYIFYGASDEMERYANANKDMSFSFVDYRLTEHTTSQTDLASGVIRNLGMANRLVSRIITTIGADASAVNEQSILGQHNSLAPFVGADGVSGGVKYNIRYNDRFEYTSDVDNTARLFSILADSEGVPFLTRGEYSNESVAGSFTNTENYDGRDQSVNLEGQLFYLGSRLTNGRVGQRGIELFLSGSFSPSGRVPNVIKSYCEYMRVARLTDGMMEIFNA